MAEVSGHTTDRMSIEVTLFYKNQTKGLSS